MISTDYINDHMIILSTEDHQYTVSADSFRRVGTEGVQST